MFGIIGRYVKASRVACLWTRALDQASRKEHAKAFAYLKAIYDAFQVEMPSHRVNYDINILCGNLACKLGNYDLSVAATSIALRQMNDCIRGVSQWDKDYLRYYCKTILLYCTSRGKNLVLPPDIWPIDVNFGSLQREKVRPRITRDFPIY